jgi:hypothetical protein
MSNKKVPLKDRLKKCPTCGYEWLARTATPPKCPKIGCQKPMPKEVHTE